MTSRPRRRDRNMTDEDIERLWSRLQQDYSVNDTDSLTTPRLYVVKRVHALSPTCVIPASRAGHAADTNDSSPRSRHRSKSSSRPMRLYFNTAELTDGTRRSFVQVKSAVLRLHWTGHLPQLRRSRDRRRDVSEDDETSRRVLTRRRRPPGDEPTSRTWNATSATTLRLLVYQLSKHSSGFNNRRGGRKLVKSERLRQTREPRWINVDVRSAVEQWIKRPHRNFGLQVVIRDARRRRRRREYDTLSILDGYDCCNSGNSLDDGPDDVADQKNTSRATYPTLDVILLQRTRRRRHGVVVAGSRRRQQRRRMSRGRRDVIEVDEDSTCAMERMHVSFAEIGYDDVILAPKSFATGYCHGSCPTHDQRHSDSASCRTGCVPSTFSPLSVITMNEHNEYTLDVISDIIVTSCHCVC